MGALNSRYSAGAPGQTQKVRINSRSRHWAALPHLRGFAALPHLRRLAALPHLRGLPAAGLGRGRAVAALYLKLLEGALLGPAIVYHRHRGRASDVEEEREKERKEDEEDAALHRVLEGREVLSSRGVDGRSV